MIPVTTTIYYHYRPLQAFAVLVSAMSHDVDHRGTNNRFQAETNSELYKIYDTMDSILEVSTEKISDKLGYVKCNNTETPLGPVNFHYRPGRL